MPLPVDDVECAHCRMIISAETGGGELVSTTEETRFYDDIGCLAADAGEGSPEATRSYVRFERGVWLEARSASYARPAGAETPMGSGVLAYRTKEEARAADREGRALTWSDVLQLAGGHQ